MWTELARGAIIAVAFFYLGAQWVMSRWRRELRRSMTVLPARGTLVGIAGESVEKGQPLVVDLTAHFPSDDET